MRPIDLVMAARTDLAKEFLFVVTDVPGFKLSISVEALDMNGLEKLTESLLVWLEGSIPYSHINLVREIQLAVNPESKQEKIVVSLDFDHTDKAAAVAIDLAIGYLTSFATDQGREVVLLKEGQRFVPLLFQHKNHGACMSVLLPEPLTLRRPPHLSAEEEDVLAKTHQFVAQLLTAVLDPYGIDRISVQPNGDGLVIVKVFFYTGDIREAVAKDVQRLVLEVLGHHVAIEGFDHPSTDLVLGIVR